MLIYIKKLLHWLMELNGKRKKYSNGKQVDRAVSHHETMEERMTYKEHFSFGKGTGRGDGP